MTEPWLLHLFCSALLFCKFRPPRVIKQLLPSKVRGIFMLWENKRRILSWRDMKNNKHNLFWAFCRSSSDFGPSPSKLCTVCKSKYQWKPINKHRRCEIRTLASLQQSNNEHISASPLATVLGTVFISKSEESDQNSLFAINSPSFLAWRTETQT